ncbi:ECF transporter S component [Neobacillus sp. FSL H8-0543]|uniref:ECF transporter S component n=1 Tax=Neobacillus sp. FSL H8-0543 TaxID=2954672 RepID=UPI0031584C9A
MEATAAVYKGKKQKKGLSTLDIVLMAILAIVHGIAMTYVALLNQVLTAMGGPILTSVIIGLFTIHGVLAMYIIRKPGAALVTCLISGVVQILAGNPNGLISMVAASSYGVGIEVAFAFFKYRRYDFITLSIAGFTSMPIWFVIAGFWFGYINWGVMVMITAFLVRCLSGVILSGWISKILGDTLSKTGILNGFNISTKKSA